MARNDVVRVSAPNTTRAEKEHRRKIAEEERERSRPRLERANPNAVSVAEDRTMLERLRGEPLSRKDIRRIARDNGGVADRIVGLVDAALEGLEVAGGMSGPGPRAYGGSKTPGAATPVITSRNGVHKLRGFFADGRFFPGLPSDPATLPQENKPTRIHHGSRNSSGFGAVKVVPGDTSGFVFGYGASFSRRRSVARDLYALGDEYAEPTGREGYRSGYVRNGANIADMDFSKLSGKEFFNTLTADEVRTLRSLAERETRPQMRTGKTISAWQAILEALDNPTSERPTAYRPTSGAGYVFTLISDLGREDGYAGARFIQDYFKNRGYDGVSYRNGNSYEDEVLLFNPERDFMEDQATDTPLTPIEVQQASKGGNASEPIRAAEDAGDNAPDLTGMSNFLATDRVPDTIFGIPVVSRREDYTEEDLAFFRANPRAGGYYDMGDEGEPPEGPATEPQGPRGGQKGGKTRGKYPGTWNNPGNVQFSKEVMREGQTGRTGKDNLFLTFDTPQNGLNAMADVIRQIATVKIPERFDEERLADNRFTPRTLVEVYAPSEDGNDVDDYTGFIGGKLGVGPNDELRLDDTEKMADLLEAMVRRDSGHPHADWFTRQEYIDAAKRMKGAK